MKKLLIAAPLTIGLFSAAAVAQVTPASANNHSTNRTSSSVTTGSKRKRLEPSTPTASTTSATTRPVTAETRVWGNAPATAVAERPRLANVEVPARTTSITTNSLAPTQIYRVGVGDILDIQIPDSLSTRSTLFTVTEGGLLEYPLVGAPISIAGLTADEIAERLSSSVKVLDKPQITVKIRDYASHTVRIIGFVSSPGIKVLRREAVPAYVLLSEAMPLSEASTVTIVRNKKDLATVNLRDMNAMGQLVIDGDILKVSGMTLPATEFFFVGGEVNAPGQKPFHSGLTLTQAILASGGTSLNASSIVRVSRQSIDGRLNYSEYNLKNIQNGKIADPFVQKDDRIEVSRNN